MFKYIIIILLFFSFIYFPLFSQESRFPQPEFDIEYNMPVQQKPPSRDFLYDYPDAAILVLSLLAAAYILIKKRNRKFIYLILLISVLYFGFFKKGCICSVGSIQNIFLIFFKNDYLLPVSVLFFFFIPLIFTLFFGRIFCSSVCPFGAVQELFLFKAIKIPKGLDQVLSIIPYFYFGAALLFVYTGTGFLICEYDPFISFFRQSGDFSIIIFGIIILILAIFIARPYCRYLCPYSVLLKFFSRFSRKHISITPSECIQCRLCEDSCPVDAIKNPTVKIPQNIKNTEIKQMRIILLIIPVLIILFAFSLRLLGIPLSYMHNTVQLASIIEEEKNGSAISDLEEVIAFKSSGQSESSLYEDAALIQKKFKKGLLFLGIYIGLVVYIKIILYYRKEEEPDFTINYADCVSCGRCMDYCPVEK